MVSNAVVTLVNKADTEYRGTVYEGCSLIGKSEKTATEKGLICSDYFVLRIPFASAAAPPKIEPLKTYAVIGEVREITSLPELMKQYKVYTVMSFKENLTGSDRVKHWRADLK